MFDFSFLAQIFQVASAGLQVHQSFEKKKNAKKTAKDIRQASKLDQDRKRREVSRLTSSQRVAYAKAGVNLDGTPTAVMEDSQEQGQMDIDLIKAQGESKAGYYESVASQSNLDAFVGGAAGGYAAFDPGKSGTSLATRLFS